MADKRDDSRTRRENYYDQQRSSLRSARSNTSSPRPQTAPEQDFTLPSGIENLNDVEGPAPVQSPRETPTYRSRDIEFDSTKSTRGSRSGRGSTPSARPVSRRREKERPGSENGYSTPGDFENLDEVVGPAPVENPSESSLYRHQWLEAERTRSKSASLSKRPTSQSGLLIRRPTDPSLTALPTIPDDASKEDAREEAVPEDYTTLGKTTGRRPASRFTTELYTISYLILFSILGTLARLGLQWLTFYPGAPVVFPVLWANFSGTLVMGFLAEDRHLFREKVGKGAKKTKLEVYDEEKGAKTDAQAVKEANTKYKKTVPLFTGLATGFCGSFTSFSSFIRDVFFALDNSLPSPINHLYPPGTTTNTGSTVSRHGGYSFMAVCAVIILTVGVCYSALKVGAHIAILLEPITPTFPYTFLRNFLDRLVVIVGFGAWIGAIIMAIWPPDRPGGPVSKGFWDNETWRGQAIFACAFAPVGCLMRFYVSLKLNGLISSFPLGTFCVNIFGTAVLGMAFDLQHIALGGSGLAGAGRVPCQVLQGVMDGFCGCLTTVSTWVVELNGLRRWNAYRYGISSVLVALGVLVAVMGSVRWSIGFVEPMCAV